MTFMKTKYGERHIVDFYKAPLKLTELQFLLGIMIQYIIEKDFAK